MSSRTGSPRSPARGLIHTKGDANATADVWEIRPDQVQGKVVYRLRGLGYALVFLRQPGGIAAVVCTVFAIVLLWQLFFNEVATSPRDADDNTESEVYDSAAQLVDA